MMVDYFADLRTEQQLGYTVQAYARKMRGVWYMNFIVVSSCQDPNYCDAKTNLFLQNFRAKLGKMNLEEFEEIKRGAIANVN